MCLSASTLEYRQYSIGFTQRNDFPVVADLGHCYITINNECLTD